MFFKTLLTTTLAATALGISLPKSGLDCLTVDPTEEQLAALKEMSIAEAQLDISQRSPNAITYIDTYVHVVSDSTAASSWYLSRDTVNKQIDVLNYYYADTGYQYTLRDIDWTVNPGWAINNNDEIGMKRTLRRGDYKTLNLYYVTDISGHHTSTGHCTLPFSNATGTVDGVANDGCVMSAWTAPGGDSPVYSTGRITVHEVGHWHNLLHTFYSNSCSGYGDYVDDTPAEASASYGCAVGRDTCSSPGVDPIHNHMDYSDDTCKTEFTAGQIARMHSSWAYYRA